MVNDRKYQIMEILITFLRIYNYRNVLFIDINNIQITLYDHPTISGYIGV